jgi:hypothetical protein
VITTDLLSIEQIRQQRKTSMVGRVLPRTGCVDSTNARCRALAREGAPEGLVVLAEEQRKIDVDHKAEQSGQCRCASKTTR